MKLGIKGTVLLVVTFTVAALTPAAHAAHATNFLDALQSEVTNRIANLNTNATMAERRALSSANTILKRNTRTLSADLSVLAAAATALDKQFKSNATLASLENDALASYSAEAHAQLDAAELRVGTNSISRGLSNQLAKVRVALTNADANTNGVPARARALAQVFNKMRMPVAKIVKKYPEIPFEAPTEIATGKVLVLTENAIVNDQTKFFFRTTADTGERYLHHTSDNPEEVGTWTYERLTTKTAVLHCRVDATQQPGGMQTPYSHDMPLTFTSATGGTFTGVNAFGEQVQGTFGIF